MKIDQMEITKIIKNSPLEPISKTKNTCPSPKKLIALLRVELSDRRRSRVIDHLSGCSSCAQEIKFINEILTEEISFDKETAQIIAARNLASRKKGTIRISPFPQLSWSSRSVVAVVMTIILSASAFFLIKTNKPARERNSSFQVNLISPNKISPRLSDLFFEWENVADTEYNIVEISDDSLTIIWRSERILNNKLIPSPELKELLKKEATYLWMVTSFLENGNQVESTPAKFSVK